MKQITAVVTLILIVVWWTDPVVPCLCNDDFFCCARKTGATQVMLENGFFEAVNPGIGCARRARVGRPCDWKDYGHVESCGCQRFLTCDKATNECVDRRPKSTTTTTTKAPTNTSPPPDKNCRGQCGTSQCCQLTAEPDVYHHKHEYLWNPQNPVWSPYMCAAKNSEGAPCEQVQPGFNKTCGCMDGLTCDNKRKLCSIKTAPSTTTTATTVVTTAQPCQAETDLLDLCKGLIDARVHSMDKVNKLMDRHCPDSIWNY